MSSKRRRPRRSLELSDVHTYLRVDPGAEGDLARGVRTAKIVTLLGAKRPRASSTTLRSINGSQPPGSQGKITFPGVPRHHRRPRPTQIVEARHRAVAGRAGDSFPRMTVIEKPRDGRVPAHRTGRRFRADMDRVFEFVFPRLARAPQPEGGDDCSGRRAGRCARFGRALDGAGPSSCCSMSRRSALAPIFRRADLRHHQADQRAGKRRSCSSSRTLLMALDAAKSRLRPSRTGQDRFWLTTRRR